MLLPSDLLKLIAIYAITKPTACVETVKFLRPDGEIVDSVLQVSEQDVHIEDFFWTGSGDGSYPPAYRRFPVVGQSDGGPSTNTIIRTATVLATVFVNNNEEQEDAGCIFDCDDQTGSPPEKIVPEDRRFWLMTVIAGVFEPDDFPVLEDKLAKLYRIAFTRQQARHLGLTKNTPTPNAPDPTPTSDQSRKKRDTTQPHNIAPSRTVQPDVDHEVSLKNENIFINENTAALRSEILRRRRRKSAHKSVHKRDTKALFDKLKKDNLQIIMQNKTTDSPNRRKAVDFQQVDVFIHNMTLMGEEENGNLVVGGVSSEKPNAAVTSNQTEIIYSVFVAGKPVLATTASEDMQLLSQDEVNLVMEKLVYIKAEPYLKEPLATPLVPATANGNASLVAVFGKNTLLFIILCATIVLLVFLLLGLLLTTAAKRKRDERLRRFTSTQTYMRSHTPGDDIATIKSEYGFEDDEDGLDNVGYEQEPHDVTVRQPRLKAPQRMSPILNFPHPPTSRPPSCSTSSTSDSSVYYPKEGPNAERTVTDRREMYSKVAGAANPEAADLYSSVAKPKEAKKANSRLAKLKTTRRKYLKTENRVGSLEQVEVHTSATQSPSDGYEKPLCLTTKIPYEHNGNEDSVHGPVISHYHRNKVITDLKFIEAPDDPATDELESPTEAVNRKVLQKLESQEMLSPDKGSIGSYLSMGSVRSFPKCAVPEPLSRVLEPTTLTHLDQLDMDPNIDRKLHRVPTYEEKNDPLLTRSHSDGADPGVVGPIVWQIHKESLQHDKGAASPLRDPAKTRSRFENLLDGAMKFYETPPYPPPAYDDNCTNSEMPGAVKPKDYRVKTAAAATIKLNSRTSGILSRSGQELDRPITAGALPTHTIRDSLPPTPSKGAWGSGKQSPQVRPLSAGPFHKPSAIPVAAPHPPPAPIVDVPRVLVEHNQLDATTLSAAPLINAITDELKRFNETRKHEN